MIPVVLYARVSSREQEREGAGAAGVRRGLHKFAVNAKLSRTGIFRDEPPLGTILWTDGRGLAPPEVIGVRSAYVGFERKSCDAVKGLTFPGECQGFDRLATIAAGDEEIDA